MKRIGIFMDGTWQRLSQVNLTNIAKLAQSVAYQDAEGREQIVFYNRGVGAHSEISGESSGGLAAGIVGAGLEANILEAYLFLCWNYQAGDKIYIFGFSRGAFSARSLAGMIRKCGILKRRYAELSQEAYQHYRNRKIKPDDEIMLTFRREYSVGPIIGDDNPHNMPPVAVDYLGVFDTVGQRGLPNMGVFSWIANRKFQFHDLSLGRHVLSARHAVALDERRKTFPVTPWNNLTKRNTDSGADPDSYEAPFQQRWFPGGHGDVGGGSESDLPNITARWVADGAIARGFRFDESRECWLGILSENLEMDVLSPFSVNTGGLMGLMGVKWREIEKFRRKETPTPALVQRHLSTAALARYRADQLNPLYRPACLKRWAALLQAEQQAAAAAAAAKPSEQDAA